MSAASHRANEAIRELLETLRRDPRNVRSYLALGALYKMGGRGELAMKLYEEGLRHDPDAHPLRAELRDLHGLRLELSRALHHASELVLRRRHPSDLLAFGKLAVAAGEIEAAETAFRAARDLAPEAWEPYFDLAELHGAAGFEDEALEEHRRAVELAHDDWRPFNGLGLALLARDEYEEARTYLTQAVELDGTRPEPHLNLALALAKLGDHERAAKHARDAHELAIDGDTLQEQAKQLLEVIAK